jgi:hypothetical protein
LQPKGLGGIAPPTFLDGALQIAMFAAWVEGKQ